jgi:holin-like protein
MRLLTGIAWLWAFLGLGELAVRATQLPVPGSIAGMLLLLAALETGAVRLAWLDRGAGSLLAVLGLLFVPAGVGFLQYVQAGTAWIAVAVVVSLGALITLAVTGHVVQRAVRHG